MEPLFDSKMISECLKILNVPAKEELIQRVSGRVTEGFNEKLSIFGDQAIDGFFRFVKDKKDQLTCEFVPKSKRLSVPDEVLGQRLTSGEQKALKQCKTVLLQPRDHIIGVQMDSKRNVVSFKTEKSLGLMRELGGYRFSLKESEALLNGEKLAPKVYYDKQQDQYIQAAVQQFDKELRFTDAKKIPKEKALKMMEAQQSAKKSIVDSLSGIAKEAVQNNISQKAVHAIAQKDYKTLHQLSTHAYFKSEKNVGDLLRCDVVKSLSKGEKAGVRKIVSSQLPKKKYQKLSKPAVKQPVFSKGMKR